MGLFGSRKKEAAPAPAKENLSSGPGFTGDKVSGAVIDDESFKAPGEMLAAQQGGAGSRMYNPYAGLPGAFDPAMSRQLLQLPEAPEFVFSEEAAVKHRGVSENLTFITGSAYLCGALAGGAYGSYQALSQSHPGASDSTKLRLNRVLNMGGHRGRNLGNTLGVLGLLYSGIQSFSSYVRMEHDSINTIIAGGGTGAFYKMAAGPRAAAVWGAGGALLAGAVVAGNMAVDSVLH